MKMKTKFAFYAPLPSQRTTGWSRISECCVKEKHPPRSALRWCSTLRRVSSFATGDKLAAPRLETGLLSLVPRLIIGMLMRRMHRTVDTADRTALVVHLELLLALRASEEKPLNVDVECFSCTTLHRKQLCFEMTSQ